MPDFGSLVESISARFGCDWDRGTSQNVRLSERLSQLMMVLEGIPRNSQATILAEFIEATMHLDADDAGRNEIERLIFVALT